MKQLSEDRCLLQVHQRAVSAVVVAARSLVSDVDMLCEANIFRYERGLNG